MAKGSYVTGQHGRLDSEIQNLQGRTEKVHSADTYISLLLFQLTGKKCSIRNSNAIILLQTPSLWMVPSTGTQIFCYRFLPKPAYLFYPSFSL